MTPEKDNIKRLLYSTREFLNSKMTLKTAADLKENHGIVLEEGATHLDAIKSVAIKKAREGDPEYLALAKEFGLIPDGADNE